MHDLETIKANVDRAIREAEAKTAADVQAGVWLRRQRKRATRDHDLQDLYDVVGSNMKHHPLRRVRKALRYSVLELAAKAKVSPRTVQAIELREYEPKRETLRKLARALQVDISDLTEDTA